MKARNKARKRALISLSSVHDSDCDSDGSVAIADLPPNRDGATNASSTRANAKTEPTATESNYCTVTRWEYRLALWIIYMLTPEPREFPKKKDYLLSDEPPDADFKTSFEYLVWGNDAGSLQSLHDDLQARLCAELHQSKDSLRSLVASLSSEVAAIESTRFDHEETPATSNTSTEQLEIQRLKEQLLKATQGQSKAIEGQIKAIEGQIKAIEGQIKKSQDEIKAVEREIMANLKAIIGAHKIVREALVSLAGKGNETAGSSALFDDENERIDSSPSLTKLSRAEEISNALPDASFLTELLEKEEIAYHKVELLELQTFVHDLLKNTESYEKTDPKDGNRKEIEDKKIKATVDAILDWKSGTTVESLGQLKGRFACPPAQGCETCADQPILGALIVRILAILSPGSLSLRSEQVVASVRKKGRGRRIDFLVDTCKEFLHVLFPEMLGRVIEVKTAANVATELDKNQRKGREQVLGHLAKRLRCALDFGGIGQEDVACGIVLSIKFLQVLEMKLTRDGSDVLEIGFRQTEQVPLLEGNGVLLLASALLDLRKNSTFGKGEELSFEDTRAPQGHSYCKIQSLLGSGGFAHVVKLDEKEFMKIARSQPMEKSLIRECKMLQRLNGDNNQAIPRTMQWGVSKVKLAIQNEISVMKVLRLTGIIGYSLGSGGLKIHEDHIVGVIKKVYDALEYAHGKRIVHMDVRPSNIIVKSNENDWDVLLADWGCAMFDYKAIKGDKFVGCPPYAHDSLLKKHGVLKPQADYDFASLGYTWYHVVEKVLVWRIDKPLGPIDELKIRKRAMQSFVQKVGNNTADMIPKVLDLFAARSSDDSGKSITGNPLDGIGKTTSPDDHGKTISPPSVSPPDGVGKTISPLSVSPPDSSGKSVSPLDGSGKRRRLG